MAKDREAGTRRLAYVAPTPLFFVAKDLKGLGSSHRVEVHYFRHGTKWLLPVDLFLQFLFLLSMKAKGVKELIAHFAGYHTVLPTLLGFRTFIIVAGADACSFPGISYGGFRKRVLRSALSWSMRKAHRLLPVHASLERFRNTYSTLGPVEQGYAHYVPGLAGKSTELPYGFDMKQWTDSGTDGVRHGAICVATGAQPGNPIHYRKGLDLILEAAAALPGTTFSLVGLADINVYRKVPGNVELYGVLPPDRLRTLYAARSIYLQPSVMEGFPNALCEAMLMGCVPIVSRVTSMPGIVGDTGKVMDRRDPGQLVAAIREIETALDDEILRMRAEARSRIAGYTMEGRMGRLRAMLAE